MKPPGGAREAREVAVRVHGREHASHAHDVVCDGVGREAVFDEAGVEPPQAVVGRALERLLLRVEFADRFGKIQETAVTHLIVFARRGVPGTRLSDHWLGQKSVSFQ